MATADLNHGPRTTGEEYDRRVTVLVPDDLGPGSKEAAREHRHRELDAAIDHRLGMGFPQARREAWKRVADRADRWAPLLGLSIMLGTPALMRWTYRRVLSRAEFDAFFQAP